MAESLRQLKPEGSLMKDRFQSFVERNLIEPRLPVGYVPHCCDFWDFDTAEWINLYTFFTNALSICFLLDSIASAADTDSRRTRSTRTNALTTLTTVNFSRCRRCRCHRRCHLSPLVLVLVDYFFPHAFGINRIDTHHLTFHVLYNKMHIYPLTVAHL